MEKQIYEIMHENEKTAEIDTAGHSKIYREDFMPYALYLEEEEDIDTLVNNITNFYYWCATRVLTLDRKYAKEILNSIGMKQAVTDRDRAEIALSYRCASLTDVFWVRKKGEQVSFREINLYENHLDNVFMDIALRGRQYTVNNEDLAKDLSTNGVFPKAWQRKQEGFVLLKDGGREAVERELLASQICQCFAASQVVYEKAFFDKEPVTLSWNITSKEYSIVSMESFEIYIQNHGGSVREAVLALDSYNYYMMNILDYLTGNTDRHWGNWGVLVENQRNKPVSLHKLMDFNQAFHAYDKIEGSNCQTGFGERMTQREAAQKAVREIGLNQRKQIKQELFSFFPEYWEMFQKRLELLKDTEKQQG